ncbi:odorant receptor 67a-like [Spodoptera litura]|uniref:Odorant receptor n=1 Tax=Spodoptera litura TaxID=69820 RepID=A0A9J7E723_SPOLT
MRVLSHVWRRISQSKALELAGPLETAFFASVYRLSFVVGLSTSDDYLLYTMYSSFIRIISALVVWFEIWSVLGNTDVSLDQIISSVNVIFIHLVTFWKLVTVVKNKRIFKKLAKALESSSFDMSTERRKRIVNDWILINNKYLKVILTLGCLTLIVWELYPMIDELKFNLMVDVKLPFEYQSLLTYLVTYTAVAIMFAYASLMVIISEVMMQAHLIRLICQFDVLADCFENIFEECAKEFPDLKKHEQVKDKTFVDKYVKRLGDLVAQHREILDQTNDLRTILSAPLLGQLACSGLLICFVGYQATATIAENLGKFVMSLLYLGYNMFTWYLMCRWCEEITIKSQRIGQSAYFSGWESGISLAPGARATIVLVIARANKPLVFVAGGMYTLSLSSYTTLVKASYSALNILLTMSHE